MHSILMEDPFISRAALFSARRFAFAGCFSPYSGQAYINHSKAVAYKIAQYPHSKKLLACAWLHSSLTFQFTDSAELDQEFGDDIAQMISLIASLNVPRTADTKTLARFDCHRVNTASAEVQTLVLAELIILGETLYTHNSAQFKDFLCWLNLNLKTFPAAYSDLKEEARQFIDVNINDSIAH